jgi:hypothetical protein
MISSTKVQESGIFFLLVSFIVFLTAISLFKLKVFLKLSIIVLVL